MKYASSRTDRIDLYWSHWPDNVTPGEEIVRGFEADLFPASHALGLGIVTWSPLGAGMLTGKYRKGEKGRAEGFGGKVFQAENSEQRTQVLDTVIAIANELGVSPGQIAIAWSGTHGSCPSSARARLSSWPTTSQPCRLNCQPSRFIGSTPLAVCLLRCQQGQRPLGLAQQRRSWLERGWVMQADDKKARLNCMHHLPCPPYRLTCSCQPPVTLTSDRCA